MKRTFVVVLSLTLGLLHGIILPVESAKILVITVISMISHKNVYTPLMNELAKRGHEITIVSPVKNSKGPRPNIREIHTLDLDELGKKHGFPDLFQVKESWFSFLASNPFLLSGKFNTACEMTLDLPEVQEILKEKYDLIFLSSFLNECAYGIAHHLNTTTVLYSTIAAFPWTVGNFGGPNPPSFVPSPFFRLTHRMGYLDRLTNLAGLSWLYFFKKVFYEPTFERTYRAKINPNLPSVAEIEANASLILSNSHFSLNYPRPLMPDVIDVGGMHCRPAEQLEKDLNNFLSSSGKDGFIYFSMGSGLKAHTMPEKYRQIFVNTFARMKERILWKWETGTMDNIPSNVRLCTFCPQQDILGHPNIKVFLTHGGLLSTQEAVYHGVPLVGIPMFGDQMWNMAE